MCVETNEKGETDIEIKTKSVDHIIKVRKVAYRETLKISFEKSKNLVLRLLESIIAGIASKSTKKESSNAFWKSSTKYGDKRHI